MKNYLFACVLAFGFNVSFAAEKVDLLILGGTVVAMDEARTIIQDGAVAVNGGTIVAVGTKEEIGQKYTSEKILNGDGKAVVPGLINGHTHLPMSLFRGIADDLNLSDWLMNFIFPAEARNVSEAFVRAGTRLAMAEMFRAGTTTVVDMYFFEDAIADEAAKAGMRGIFGEGILDFPTPDSPTFEDGIKNTEKLIQKWKGHPLIQPAVAPHAVYTLSEEHLKQASELAKREGVPIVIHLSETEKEVADIEQAKGKPPIAYLDQIGFFGGRVIAAHIVFPKPEEIPILKEKKVGVIHNPQSNMKLSSGIAPIPDLLHSQIDVGIGTDGAASNNNLSLWEEMDIAAKLHKVASKDPTVVSAQEAFAMATINGARALGMEKEVGSIETGKKGDIVLVDLDGFHQIPNYNIYSTLIYATGSGDVRTVVINGQVVMEDRRLLTLDENQIKTETARYCDQIKKSLEME